METFIEVRLFKGKGDFSNQEMQDKTSPINVFWLRRLSVVGLLEKYVIKGIEVCEAAEKRTTEMPGIVQALKRFQGMFKGVRIYFEEKARHDTDAAGSE